MRRDRRLKKSGQCGDLEGVITFFGSHHALRAEKVLTGEGFEVALIPGPREISPNCGVALRFDYSRKEECSQILERTSVQIEAMHHYPEKR